MGFDHFPSDDKRVELYRRRAQRKKQYLYVNGVCADSTVKTRRASCRGSPRLTCASETAQRKRHVALFKEQSTGLHVELRPFFNWCGCVIEPEGADALIVFKQ